MKKVWNLGLKNSFEFWKEKRRRYGRRKGCQPGHTLSILFPFLVVEMIPSLSLSLSSIFHFNFGLNPKFQIQFSNYTLNIHFISHESRPQPHPHHSLLSINTPLPFSSHFSLFFSSSLIHTAEKVFLSLRDPFSLYFHGIVLLFSFYFSTSFFFPISYVYSF
jgi:hypothetical protein